MQLQELLAADKEIVFRDQSNKIEIELPGRGSTPKLTSAMSLAT